jgi:DHA1 family tetracycline resistance protein-like MFS transporter
MNKSSWRQYTQFWYSGYAFQGMVVFGTGAILMPIFVNHAGDVAKAGMVMGFFYIGQLLAPLMGTITDRTGKHRFFYLMGYVLLAIGLVLFPFTKILWFWMALAFIQGVGSGTTNTVAAMLIVEYNPKKEWDTRVGWLQTFYGIGMAVGLGLASVLQVRPELGLLISACLMVPGIILGSRGLPPSTAHHKPAKVEFSRRTHLPPRFIISMLTHYENVAVNTLKSIFRIWHSKFGVYIFGWFFIMLATWIIGALFPLLMKGAFDIPYNLSSLYYAAGAVIGIFIYTPMGSLGKKIGDGWVLIIGSGMTLVSVTGMAVFSHIHTDFNQLLVPFIYVLTPIAWPPLIVGGTAWAAHLADFAEGEALGMFNGTTAIAAVIAAFAAGQVAHNFGYDVVLIIGAAASLMAVICFLSLIFKFKQVKQ